MEINNVYSVNHMRDRFSYAGTLRNERKFDFLQNVWVNHKGNEIFKGKIIGIEISQDQNPEYTYKIEIPEAVVESYQKFDDFTGDRHDFSHIEIRCDSIFDSPKQAKESAIRNLENKYSRQKQEIERYFNQFKE